MVISFELPTNWPQNLSSLWSNSTIHNNRIQFTQTHGMVRALHSANLLGWSIPSDNTGRVKSLAAVRSQDAGLLCWCCVSSAPSPPGGLWLAVKATGCLLVEVEVSGWCNVRSYWPTLVCPCLTSARTQTPWPPGPGGRSSRRWCRCPRRGVLLVHWNRKGEGQ